MVQEINQWLSDGQAYEAGVALYNKYGASAVRKRMFESGPSSFNAEKLLQSLQELVPADAPEPAASRPRKAALNYSAKTEASIPAPNPADQQPFEELMLQRQSYLDERTIAHSKLSMVKTDEERLELALRIHDLVPQIKKLNYIRKYYLQHTCLPPELKLKAKVDESDKAALLQHRQNLRSSRSKLRKHPEKVAELETIEKEINRLTTLINTK